MRTDNNKRQRPNDDYRFLCHQGLVDDDHDKLKLINQMDLEWLACNWRLKVKKLTFTSSN